MGFSMPEIRAVFREFRDLGGHCDCEIVLNIVALHTEAR